MRGGEVGDRWCTPWDGLRVGSDDYVLPVLGDGLHFLARSNQLDDLPQLLRLGVIWDVADYRIGSEGGGQWVGSLQMVTGRALRLPSIGLFAICKIGYKLSKYL